MSGDAMRRVSVQALVVVLVFLSNFAYARSAGSDVESAIVTTRHSITVGGRPIAYTARAGYIPLVDEATGEVHARIFFVSYTADAPGGRLARPLTFYSNGGPGAPGTLDDLGPRSLDNVKVQEHLPPPPYAMVDNQKTWLAFTDLVLIDPVGTGYSRAARPEYAAEYYNPRGDAQSIAQFIRLYLQRFEPVVRQPIFLAGVSYGAIRAALIADIAKRRGIPLRGVILASSPLANQPRRGPADFSDLACIQLLPSFTATAFFHQKLAPGLQRNFDETIGLAESWAQNVYPKILEQGKRLPDRQLQAAAGEMARLTGISADFILEHHFRVPPDDFLRQLLGAQWTPTGLADSRRLKAYDAESGWDRGWYSVLSSLYLRKELRFNTETPYASFIGSFVTVFLDGWHCGAGGGNDCAAYPRAWVALQHAMRENPALRVMITNGYYDLGCPYFGTKMAISQLEPDLRARVTAVYYQAGHNLPPEHREAVARFIRSVLATSGKAG